MESENSGIAPSDSTPQVSETTPTDTTPPSDPQTGQPIQIDQLDRYQYQGKSLKDWASSYMRQQDYTHKTTQIAQERKFFDNLAYDLDRVKQNPTLAEQFRKIYPEKFHPYLRYVSGNSPGQEQNQQQYARLDPAMEQRVMGLEKQFRDKEVAAISADLDRKFEKFSQKYPYADEEAVVARAQALLVKMKELYPDAPKLEITEKQWDLLWKSQHDRAYQLADSSYKKQVQNQIQAHRKNADPAGKGGGLPGQSPRQFKTLKEATNAALADIEAGSF